MHDGTVKSCEFRKSNAFDSLYHIDIPGWMQMVEIMGFNLFTSLDDATAESKKRKFGD